MTRIKVKKLETDSKSIGYDFEDINGFISELETTIMDNLHESWSGSDYTFFDYNFRLFIDDLKQVTKEFQAYNDHIKLCSQKGQDLDDELVNLKAELE